MHFKIPVQFLPLFSYFIVFVRGCPSKFFFFWNLTDHFPVILCFSKLFILELFKNLIFPTNGNWAGETQKWAWAVTDQFVCLLGSCILETDWALHFCLDNLMVVRETDWSYEGTSLNTGLVLCASFESNVFVMAKSGVSNLHEVAASLKGTFYCTSHKICIWLIFFNILNTFMRLRRRNSCIIIAYYVLHLLKSRLESIVLFITRFFFVDTIILEYLFRMTPKW